MKNEKGAIQATTKYGMFKNLEGNRPLNKGLLRVINESVRNDGNYLQYNPIIVNEKMEVIDGQHRLKVAEELEKTIYYIVADGFTLHQAQILNSRKREWRAIDFLNSYIVEGKRDYQEIYPFMEEYLLSLSIAVKLLSKQYGQAPMNRFRAGNFVVVDKAWAENAAGLLSTIRDHSPDYAFAHGACIRAVGHLLDVLSDPKVFERQLARYQQTITRRVSVKDYLKQFQLILDMGGDSGIKLL